MAGYLVEMTVWKLVEPRVERMAGEMVGWSVVRMVEWWAAEKGCQMVAG